MNTGFKYLRVVSYRKDGVRKAVPHFSRMVKESAFEFFYTHEIRVKGMGMHGHEKLKEVELNYIAVKLKET